MIIKICNQNKFDYYYLLKPQSVFSVIIGVYSTSNKFKGECI